MLNRLLFDNRNLVARFTKPQNILWLCSVYPFTGCCWVKHETRWTILGKGLCFKEFCLVTVIWLLVSVNLIVFFGFVVLHNQILGKGLFFIHFCLVKVIWLLENIRWLWEVLVRKLLHWLVIQYLIENRKYTKKRKF